MGLETSPESPIQVEEASRHVQAWIRRLGAVWVEGQIAELKIRRSFAWVTLRDTDKDVSIPLTCSRSELESAEGGINNGQRVIVNVKPDYSLAQGRIQWRASGFRPVGIGQLLARIEQLRKLLAAEGLFAEERKQALPFLPRRVGLVCGRSSAARKDVEENAKLRWPAVLFEVREVPVQGPSAVAQVMGAIADLDQIPDVDVIIVTRGGGSFEDLLPFSNEALVRAVAECRTPIVSAIGHEEDVPLVDLAADWRASTPTAAAKRVVPSLADETARASLLRRRARTALATRIRAESHRLRALADRPALARPGLVIDRERGVASGLAQRCTRAERSRLVSEATALAAFRARPAFARPALAVDRQVALLIGLRDRNQRAFRSKWQATVADLEHQTARIHAMSPQATLDRGYSVVACQDAILRDSSEVALGSDLRIRLSRGQLDAVTTRIRN